MYYLAKAGLPVPAEAPYLANMNEGKEWSYHLQKHQDAVKNMKGQVDQRPPKSINRNAQAVHAITRKFAMDAKNAEIGRENGKLIEKLTKIARTNGPCAPPGYGRALRAPPRAPVPVGMPGGQARSRSHLDSNGKREEKRRMELENASMVRRILSNKSCFDRIKDENQYQRHKRNVHLLQRLPESGRKPRSLPPLRPNSHPATLRGLEGLLLPSDLQRSMSGSGLEGTRKALSDSPAPTGHATTAPPGSLQESGNPTDTQPEPPLFGTTAPISSTSPSSETHSQRREWLAPSSTNADPQQTDVVGSLGIKGDSGNVGQVGQAGIQGLSNVSDLPYAEEWDEYSFNSSANASRAAPSRGPSAMDMSRDPSGTSRGQSGLGTTAMSETGTATSSTMQPPSDTPLSTGDGSLQPGMQDRQSSPPKNALFEGGPRPKRHGSFEEMFGNPDEKAATVDPLSSPPKNPLFDDAPKPKRNASFDEMFGTEKGPTVESSPPKSSLFDDAPHPKRNASFEDMFEKPDETGPTIGSNAFESSSPERHDSFEKLFGNADDPPSVSPPKFGRRRRGENT